MSDFGLRISGCRESKHHCHCFPAPFVSRIKITTLMNDHALKKHVETELREEPALKSPAAVEVRVKHGIVTLKGVVDSDAERLVAERAAARVTGVEAVANELEFLFDATSEHSDEEIARAAASVLDGTPGIPRDQIKVAVSNGRITLKGVVDRRDTRTAAEYALKYLHGIEGIINLIEVQPKIKAA